ncbi:MAG: helix-turn-helix domain-containing protein [Nitrospiraceae bacterium]|nr:MAG: helix-turn-helix domain-containing protein [Nitrospiraceae bacterium]
MDRPGNVLREEREKQKRALSDVSKKLKINVQYLNALEEDNYEPIPAEVFTKAYLRSYAEFLGIDGDHIMGLYAGCAGNNEQEKAGHPAPPAEKPPVRKKVLFPLSRKSLLLIAFLGMAFVPLALLNMPDGEKSDAPQRRAPENIQSGPVTEPVERPAAEPGAEALSLPEEMNLTIEALELTWVSVIADQGEPREWLLRAGESLEVSAKDQFSLKIGNAGGTRVIFNNRDIGSLGPRGTIVDIVLPFEKSG